MVNSIIEEPFGEDVFDFINATHDEGVIFKLFEFVSVLFVPVLVDVDGPMGVDFGAGDVL